MEDILSILIFAVVMIFSVWSSQKKKAKTASVKTLPKDGENLGTFFEKFPSDKKDVPRSVNELDPVQLNKKTVAPEKQRRNGKTNEVKPNIASQSPAEIRLRSKEDARRAFIYSEIFNRKY